jgi:hypothetical protein
MDVIKDKFWDTASPKVIEKTVEKLEDDFECFEWSKIPKDRITAMESYLSDAFKKIILSREDKLRLFVETTKEFQHQKISLSDIFNRMDKIKQ